MGLDDQSSLRRRFVDSSNRFIEAREMTSKDIAELIRSLEIDIAIDLAGYTADSRTAVFAYRPAPVQVNYLGFTGTMGTEYMDYILADKYVIPEDDRVNFSEKVVWLPDTYFPTDGTLRLADRMPTRVEYGLPSSGFIFCSFNHDFKINPTMFEIWMRLLTRIPGSVLWLMKLNSSAEANLVKEAEARGVDSSRIIFATRVPSIEDHLARYQLADLFLDTIPYNAHTTTCDVLFAGLPVLTCPGGAMHSRVAGSLLGAIGIPEMIVGSLAEYEEVALKLALDSALLAETKERLRANKDTYPLFNTMQFCRNLEKAYTVMWERYQNKQPPEHFDVAGVGRIIDSKQNYSSNESKAEKKVKGKIGLIQTRGIGDIIIAIPIAQYFIAHLKKVLLPLSLIGFGNDLFSLLFRNHLYMVSLLTEINSAKSAIFQYPRFGISAWLNSGISLFGVTGSNGFGAVFSLCRLTMR